MEGNDQDEKRQSEHVLSPLLVQVRSGISSSVDGNLRPVQLFIQGTVCCILWSRLFLFIFLASLRCSSHAYYAYVFSFLCFALPLYSLDTMFGMKRRKVTRCYW